MAFMEQTMDQDGMKPKILIVDDCADDIRILWEALQADYEVFAAVDGQQALSRVASNPPELILLDVMMPGMSGHDVCRRLKADPATCQIAVIFITGLGEAQDETEGLALGAADYIAKPFRLPVVRARVASILKMKREKDLRERLTVQLKALNDHLEEKVEEQVAQLRSAHEKVKASEERLRVILENLPDLVFMTDDDGNFTYMGANLPLLLGSALHTLQSTGKVSNLVGDLDFSSQELAEKGSIQDIERIIVDQNGQERTFLIDVKRVSIDVSTQLWTCREITERKKLEIKLRQAYKMEAIGTLAGGIAHDFNNILSAMVGYTEISREAVDREDPIYEYLTNVLNASGRAKDLVNQILLFSREKEQELKPLMIKLPIKEALKLIRASVPTTIDIRQNIRSGAAVLADPTQIHQLVMNLCTNAAHAMRQHGGLLSLSLVDTLITSEQASAYPDLPEGAYVKLSVSDTGHGIPPHLMNRIFDPFFSTKPKGEGTGMGLALVHGIVKSYGGGVYVHSQVDQGTTFDILLPRIEKSPEHEFAQEEPLARGNETILFVDDETMIVGLAQKMLESLGYHVIPKTVAAEALELFTQTPDRFDLVVTDMTMPKMTGLDLAQKLIQIRSDLPIVLCSGFVQNIDEATAARYGIRGLVSKPILKRDIAAKVRSALDWKARGGERRSMTGSA
jgi:PAS domain S-box-containing protein